MKNSRSFSKTNVDESVANFGSCSKLKCVWFCIRLSFIFISGALLDTPCKAGARSLNFFEVQVVGQYIAKYITTSLSWPACRPSLLIHEPRTSHDVLLEPRESHSVFAGVRPDLSENVFFKFWKKSSKSAPKEGSKRVPERAAVKA